MSCEKFEIRLQALLDERLRPEDDAPLRRHADACPACRDRLAAQSALWDGLASRSARLPSVDFVERVLRNVEHDRAVMAAELVAAGRANPAPRGVGRLVAAAAILLVLAPAAYWSFRNMKGGAPEGLVQRDHDDVAPEAPPVVEKTPTAAPHEEPATAALSNEPHAGESAVGATLDGLTPEERYAMLLERWQAQLPELGGRLGLTGDPPASPGAAAVSQLTDRIRTPLSSSLNATLNVLRTALPTGAEQSPAKPQAKRSPDAVDERLA